MTLKPVAPSTGARKLPPLPDPPKKSDMQENLHFDRPAVMNTLARHFDAMRPGSTTFVLGRGYLCQRRGDLPRCPYPDMIIAFNVDVALIQDTNGFVIEEVGKPPDLVMEVSSVHTARRDYVVKRPQYAGMGVPEYWRYDHTGGRHFDAPLSGDRLTPEGTYEPMELTTEADGIIWGYSEALGLSVCWIERELRFWDRTQRRYIPTPSDLVDPRTFTAEQDARIAAQDAHIAEQDARIAAEARVQELEEELRRLRRE